MQGKSPHAGSRSGSPAQQCRGVTGMQGKSAHAGSRSGSPAQQCRGGTGMQGKPTHAGSRSGSPAQQCWAALAGRVSLHTQGHTAQPGPAVQRRHWYAGQAYTRRVTQRQPSSTNYISWYCGAGVFRLIGCKSISPSLTLSTSFNNKNNVP